MGEPLSFGETSSTAVPTKVCNSGTRTRGPRYSPCAVLSVPASTKRFRCCDGRNKPFPIFIMSGAQPEEPLYEDEFVRIAHDAIVIKAYYFPFGQWRTIPADDIASVHDAGALDVEGILACKVWGMAFNNIWWACDWKRLNKQLGMKGRTSYVVACKSPGWFRHAFSVSDPLAAQAAIQRVVNEKSPGAEMGF